MKLSFCVTYCEALVRKHTSEGHIGENNRKQVNQ